MIKKLSRKYLGEIVVLHQEAIYPIWDKLNCGLSNKEVKDFVLDVFLNGDVYGFFINNNLVATIGFELFNHGNKCEISFILVKKEFQRKGIGKQLIDYVKEKFHKKSNIIFLEVLKENPAVNFYKKLGFNIIQEKNNKYLMEKRLK
ncbi:MAG: GNAT family N-acetyltransferase [Nanoarchaeota archaeon]|nr:GNAT family N-acetyltransferase [Nanoarchaeota archaeon]